MNKFYVTHAWFKTWTESESGTKSNEPTSYQEWIKQAQVSRNTSWKFNVALHESKDTANPPHFDKVLTLWSVNDVKEGSTQEAHMCAS